MNRQKFSLPEKYYLPERLPVDREQLALTIYNAHNYLGELKAGVHFLDKWTKVLFGKLCIGAKGNKSAKETEWHAYHNKEFEDHLYETYDAEVELYRANAQVRQIDEHADKLKQQNALDRVKIEKGIYDVT